MDRSIDPDEQAWADLLDSLPQHILTEVLAIDPEVSNLPPQRISLLYALANLRILTGRVNRRTIDHDTYVHLRVNVIKNLALANLDDLRKRALTSIPELLVDVETNPAVWETSAIHRLDGHLLTFVKSFGLDRYLEIVERDVARSIGPDPQTASTPETWSGIPEAPRTAREIWDEILQRKANQIVNSWDAPSDSKIDTNESNPFARAADHPIETSPDPIGAQRGNRTEPDSPPLPRKRGPKPMVKAQYETRLREILDALIDYYCSRQPNAAKWPNYEAFVSDEINVAGTSAKNWKGLSQRMSQFLGIEVNVETLVEMAKAEVENNPCRKAPRARTVRVGVGGPSNSAPFRR